MASLESSAEESTAVPVQIASGPPPSKKQETKKRRILTLEEKYKLVKAIKNGEKNTVAAKRFDPPLSQSTISTIMKKKDEIIRAYEGGLYADKRKKMKQSTFPDLDKALSEWFRKVRGMNIPVSGPILQEKALYFAQELGYESFKASNGFLEKFKERQGISGQAVCGEEKSVDPDIVETWSERLPDICRSYSMKDRFNADETGFMWKATPNQTLNLRGEKCTCGKKSKERVTVVVACNQDGTEKLPLLVIGKYARPRCFRNSNMNLLPVTYESQKKAWMDSVLFEKWVRQIDRRMRGANHHILLFIDNCSSHVIVNGLTNTKLIFFLSNCTSKLQPADQGIIQNLKVHYRKTMIRWMLQCLDDNKPVKAIDLKDAVFMMAKAWDNVSTKTIKNCWKKAGFSGEVEEPSHDPFESDDEDEDTDELDGGLWGNITHHFPSLAETSFSNFVSFDDNVVTENQPTEEDVTREALEAVKSVELMTPSHEEEEEDGEDSDTDICIVEPKPLSLIGANEAVTALRNFILSFDKPGSKEKEFLRSLSSMEDTFLRMSRKQQRQSSLKEFF